MMTEAATSEVPASIDGEHGDHVIVCGLDGIGLRVVEQLIRSGERVSVLAEYATAPQLASAAGWGATPVASRGDPATTLRAAGIAAARAVICVVDDEFANLELTLLARDLSPQVRIVAQLGNQAIRRAVASGNGPGGVLDVADLAAPAIVEACLGRRVHDVVVGDETFLVVRLMVERAASLRSLYGDLVPIAVVCRGGEDTGGSVVDCPGRDLEVEPGDEAAMMGTAEEFARQHIDISLADVSAPAHVPSRWRRLAAQIVGVLRDFDKGLYKAIAGLLILVAVSTVVLSLGYQRPGMTVLDAIYFTAETVATVGYGDFSFFDQPVWLRVWAIFLMGGGITSTAVLMAFLTDMLISRRLNHAIGRRRARGFSGHVVVIGLGSFGVGVATALLAAGRQVVVIERDVDNRFLAEAQSRGIPVIFGDATLRSTLDAARVAQSSAVAILTSNDMINIETAIAVRDLFGVQWAQTGAVPVVTRVFDRSLGRTVSSRFGFQNVLATEELTAPWFVGAALGLQVMGSFSISQQTFMISRLTIEENSRLAGLAMNELSAGTRVIALTRRAGGGIEHRPRRETRFEAGDQAYVVGPYEELLGVLRHARMR